MKAPLKVFLSYAHEDEPHRQTLANHLSALEDEGLIAIWHDRKILGGDEWAVSIRDALASADIVLLLISADFLASKYANDVELTAAISRHDAGQTQVVPVILRSCDWQHSRFARFEVLPPDGEPVVEITYQDQRFVAVAKGLRAIVAAKLAGRTQSQTEASSKAPGAVSKTGGFARQPRARTPRRLTIGKIAFFGIELGGPFEIPLPRLARRSLLLAVAGMVLLGALVAAGYYALMVRPPLGRARDAMRIGRYDIALDSLRAVPGWLSAWPRIASSRRTAQLGARMYESGSDRESIARDLRHERDERPGDADLMVLYATYLLGKGDYDEARKLATVAKDRDANNAEAWSLLGLDLALSGDWRGAAKHYTKATLAAPDSPQYRGNLARALLEAGDVDRAIAEYRTVGALPLPLIERGLAHWAKGEWEEALDARADAVKDLDQARASTEFYDRRDWIFLLLDKGKGVRLVTREDKRCYAILAESASRVLAGEAAVVFPPRECGHVPLAIRELLADDLCRFVDAPQPSHAAEAGMLRQAIGMPVDCAAPGPRPASPAPGGSTT